MVSQNFINLVLLAIQQDIKDGKKDIFDNILINNAVEIQVINASFASNFTSSNEKSFGNNDN